MDLNFYELCLCIILYRKFIIDYILREKDNRLVYRSNNVLLNFFYTGHIFVVNFIQHGKSILVNLILYLACVTAV